jgi:hypothetical protein
MVSASKTLIQTDMLTDIQESGRRLEAPVVAGSLLRARPTGGLGLVVQTLGESRYVCSNFACLSKILISLVSVQVAISGPALAL